ncbi:MAG: CusA/CzcA family heavy metal efflux RND transporter [Planctomycetaceae bacterium]|nr:CusA/CzcA family heavy metal efflux RND transporter [Planctomycetaceae bacterium]
MIEKMMRFALHNRLLVLLLIAAIGVAGLAAYKALPIDAFPDVTNVQVEVVSNAAGMSPLEIEQFVTYPIEMSMRGIPGLETMRSTTKYGLSVVTLVFRDDVDIYFARQLVFERLSGVKERLPEGVDSEMGPIVTAMGEIYQYTLEGNEPSDPQERIAYLTELRTLQDWVVAPILKGVEGINEINSFGGYLKQYQVILSPEKLLTYKLSVRDVFDAIQQNNKNVGGNVIETPNEQYVIRGIGLLEDEQDISSIMLRSYGGTPVYLRDVGQVTAGHAIRQGLALQDGKGEAVGGVALMLKGENSRLVIERIKAKVAEINASTLLPDSIRIKPFYDRSAIVKQSMNTVTKSMIEGVILVGIVIFLLLGSVHGAIVVAVALPLSVLMTFIVMKLIGLDANLMSLGGLVISLGMVVDATIIQVENIQRHLAENQNRHPRLKTILAAALEVRKPSMFGELIIILTFVPIILLRGMEGKMFSPLAFTVAIALMASIVISLFIAPALSELFLRSAQARPSRLLTAVKRLYSPALEWSLKNKWAVILISGALITAAAINVGRLGREFVPVMDEAAFDMDIVLAPGTSLERSAMIADLVQKRLMQFEELETVVGKTGQTGIALEARGVEKTGFVGLMKPRSEWKNAASREELFARMREAIEDIPGIAYGFSQPIQCRIDELVAGTRAQVIVKLFGEDSAVLRQKIGEIAEVLSSVEGAADLVTEAAEGQPYVSIRVDRNKIARHGMNVSDVLDVIEIALGGKPASTIHQGSKAFDLTLRLPSASRNSAQALSELMIDSTQGYSIPLNELASVTVEEGPVQISRENAQRRMAVELNLQGRDIGSFVTEAMGQIRQKVALPSGYYIEWGGQFENQRQAARRLMIITPIIVGSIVVLLYVTFQSMRLALLVMCNLPFALVGGVLALMASGMYLSVPASIGFLVLLGIVVLNGIVLVSYIAMLQKDGASLDVAIRHGCMLRLRPILMTALTTLFGLIGMLLATGPGSEVQKPLAVVVAGGLATSTLATLLVLPTIYGWFAGKKTPSNEKDAVVLTQIL